MARWAGEGKRLDQSYGTTETSQGRRYSQLARIYETGGGEENGIQRDQAVEETKVPASL